MMVAMVLVTAEMIVQTTSDAETAATRKGPFINDVTMFRGGRGVSESDK